jgi:hypothetical protein
VPAQIHSTDPNFALAVELYRKAREEQSGGARPSAPSPQVEDAVKRIPGRQLSDDEAMAVVERHVAENALPIALNALRQLQGAVPAPARKTAGIWIRPKAQAKADARKATHERAVSALVEAVETLKAGRVPPMFAHLLPARAPVIHEGRDRFEADYQLVDD